MKILSILLIAALQTTAATVTMRLQSSTNLIEWTGAGISVSVEVSEDEPVKYFRAVTEIKMANAQKYKIELKTTSTDAVPSALQGTHYWYDTGTTQNSAAVYYDNASDAYAIWTSTTHGRIISVVADVGNESVANYFVYQDYPDTITVSGAGFAKYNVAFSASGEYNGVQYYKNGTLSIRAFPPVGSSYTWGIFDGASFDFGDQDYDYLLLSEDTNPPKTGWNAATIGSDPAPTLTYTIPTDQYAGQGTFSGTITLSEYTIADAWYRAEKTAFESLENYTGAEEGKSCFRGFLPVQGDADDHIDANVWQMTAGGATGDFDVERTFSSNGLWCSFKSDVVIQSVWDSRQKAMEFAGTVIAWLKETDNMNETGNVTWVTLSEVPEAPVISRTQGVNRERLWEQTVGLILTYQTETVYS